MRLQERLNQLEACEYSDDVADLLTYAGVKGRRGKTKACPVAKYLADADDCRLASVTDEFVRVETSAGNSRDVCLRTWLSSVYDFIHLFDAGEYEDLQLKDDQNA